MMNMDMHGLIINLYSSLFILQPLPPPAIKSLCLIYILVYLYYNFFSYLLICFAFHIYILVYLYYNRKTPILADLRESDLYSSLFILQHFTQMHI